jgi:hypothetical protein
LFGQAENAGAGPLPIVRERRTDRPIPSPPAFPTNTGGLAGPAAEIRFTGGRPGNLDDRMSQSARVNMRTAQWCRVQLQRISWRYLNIKRRRHVL